MIEQRAHFHLSELFSEDVMYKRDGGRTFANHLCHSLHIAFVSTFTIVEQINLRNIILHWGVAEDFERSSPTDVTTSRTALITASATVSGPCPRPTAEILRLPTRCWRTERHRRPNSVHRVTVSLLQPLSHPCTKPCRCRHS